MAGELFNGLFNTLLLGIPIWIWVLLFMVIILLFSNAYWYFFFWSPLKPLHGLWYANWNKHDAAMVSDINLNLKLVSEKNAKLIFNETVKEAKEGEIDWKEITSGQIGIVGTDIIIDIGKWTNPDSEDRYIIEEVVDKWNLDNPNNQIHSFYKFMNYVDEGKIKVDIKTKEVVEWIRIESAFPKTRKTAAYAGYVRQLAEKMDKEEGSKFDNYAIYILIGSVAVSALLIISKILLHKAG
jgi:hypothetical protein